MLKLTAVDARVKLLLLAVLSSSALLVAQPLALAALLLLSLALLLLGGVAADKIWRQSRMLLGLIVVIFVLQCLFVRGGQPILLIGGAKLWGGSLTLVYSDGWQAGLRVSLRLLIIVCSALLLLSGESRDYLLALRWLGLPWELCYMVLAGLRFIPLLREEARATADAWQMRGCDLRSAPLLSKAKLYLAMLTPISVGALQRAEAMSIAMEARGFRCQPQHSSWRRLRIRKSDLLYAAVCLTLIAAIVIFL